MMSLLIAQDLHFQGNNVSHGCGKMITAAIYHVSRSCEVYQSYDVFGHKVKNYFS